MELNSKEFKNLTSQNAISSYGGKRHLPYVYTEHGVIALAGVLKSEIAAKMSVEIARTFIQMRKHFCLMSFLGALRHFPKKNM